MKEIVKEMLKDVIVYDIETSSFKNNTPIDIRTNFNNYVKNAQIKWVGAYSYKYNRYYELNAVTQLNEIKDLFSRHSVYVGFNNEEFDNVIMKNNGIINNTYIKSLDVMKILGYNNYKHGFKNRAEYMKVNLSNNKLKTMAEMFRLDIGKGDIDYTIFYKNCWTDEEIKEIKKYLHKDVKITKELFDKTISFWELFIDWIDSKSVKNWAWINSTIAVLTYCSACKILEKDPVYDKGIKKKEEMGGRCVQPKYETLKDVHYFDEVSKYPHLFSEFNLFNEVDISGQPEWKVKQLIDKGLLFHGNEKFKVKGYYDIRNHGKLEMGLIKNLKTRFEIKKILKEYYETKERRIKPSELLKDVIKNDHLSDEIIEELKGLEYAIKIFANSLYGIARNPSFKQVYSDNCGYDCCWLGQQIHEYIQKFFEDKGYEVIGGFTDSWFVKTPSNISKEQILQEVNDYLKALQKYFPFPEDTHRIGYECYIDSIMYHYDDKKKEYKKNNYAFVSNDKIKIVGFPIMKSNASELSILIFEKYLKNEILKTKNFKFKREFIDKLIQKELSINISLSATLIRCNNALEYKQCNQIQAQISRAYLNGLEGEIKVIKNLKIGKVGKGSKYCSIQEAKENKLKYDDLILDKTWNELDPFIQKEKVFSLGDWGL